MRNSSTSSDFQTQFQSINWNFETMKTIIQTVSFVCSLVFNSILILLIITKSPKKLGAYKYLMVYFCCFAIFFSVLDMVIQPYILTVGPGFIVITSIKSTFLGELGEITFLSSLCGCFGVILTTIAVHFIFRYFALERKGKLRLFQGNYLIGWLTIPLIIGVIWTAVTVFFCYPHEITEQYSSPLLKENYNLELSNMTYIGAIYYLKDEKDQENWIPNWFHLLGMAILFSIMGISISILSYFGVKCYNRIKKLIYEGESAFTKNLQNQLYKALVFQACIPMLFLFTPIGLYLTLPLFGIQFETMGKIATFLYALYPALDPLPLFFIIDNYRFAILEFFGCCIIKNRINVEEEASVSRHVSN